MLYRKDERFLSYLLNDNNDFFEVGYKVLKSESNRSFIDCFSVKFNGKIKLMYDISSYKSCEEILLLETREKVIKVIINILRVADKVKDNGFIEFSGIENSIEKFFIDMNNLEVKLVYLPVTLAYVMTEDEFIRKIKLSIINCIKSNKNCSNDVIDIIETLNETKNTNDTIQGLLNVNITSKAALECRERRLIYEKNIKFQEEQMRLEQAKIEEKKRGGLFGFFSKGKKKEVSKRIEVNNIKVNIDKAEKNIVRTQGLREAEKYILSSISTSKPLNLIIDKSEFLIGSKAGSVDGVININNLISRRHCVVKKREDGYYMSDNGSSNGTFINGTRLEKNMNNKLLDGDIVKIANIEFIFKRM